MMMDFLSPLTAATATIVILLTIVYYFVKNRDILPGPKGLPYLGLYPVLNDEKCHLQLQEYSKKYGDLYSFTYLGKFVINLGSAKAMREIQVNKSDCFHNRLTDFNMLTYVLEEGVALANGDAWKTLRKFFIKTFKEFGLPVIRENVAGPMYESLYLTIEDFQARKDEPFNVFDVLIERCTGSMRRILLGEDVVSEEDVLKMNIAFGGSLEGMTGIKLLLTGPAAKFLYKTLPGLRKAMGQHKVLRNLLAKAAKNVETVMDENHITCVVEDFYNERNTRKRQNDSTWKYFSDKALISSLAQIVGDGILSVAYFVGIFLNALVKYPAEQDKIYEELMEVVGPTRFPSADDKNKLPYTSAFMNEVMRTSDFFPLLPSLECSKETTVRGYKIPKGAITLLNFWQAHHDPGTYENPDKFDPNRYIPSEGRPRAELPVQFGIGRRSCTGEPYVMTQAFLFLTSIVKNFVLSEPEEPKPKSDLFLMTGNLELRAHPRNEK